MTPGQEMYQHEMGHSVISGNAPVWAGLNAQVQEIWEHRATAMSDDADDPNVVVEGVKPPYRVRREATGNYVLDENVNDVSANEHNAFEFQYITDARRAAIKARRRFTGQWKIV